MRSPLRPVAATFVCFGAFWGVWAVSAVDVEDALGLGHGGFGALLAVALAASAVVNALGGTLVERWGTSAAISRSLTAWAVLLALGAAAPHPLLLAAGFTGIVAVGGFVDVAINVPPAALLAGEPGRLVRFHGFFNGGAAIGAALTGVAATGGLSWRWLWLAVACVALGLAAWSARAELPAGGPGERQQLLHGLRTIRAEHLVLLAAVFACGAMVEGGIDTWGVLFLRDRLDVGVAVGAVAATAGQAVAALARGTLGPAVGSLGSARGVAAGAGLAATGLTVLAVAPAGVAPLGLVAAVAGIAVCWPLLLAQGTAGRARPGAVVGGMTAIGYLGFVVGPPVVGWVAGVVGLRWGLLVLAGTAAFVAVAPSSRRVAAGTA